MIRKKRGSISLFIWGVFFCSFAASGLASAKDHSDAAAKIRALNDQIMAANGKGDLSGALLAAEKAFELSKTEYGTSSKEAADTMNNLANLYLYANRAAAAEQLYKQAILIDIEKMDKKGTEMADIYFNLGVAYAIQKKYMDAINILNKALVIRREKLGADNVATKKVEAMVEELEGLAGLKTEKI